jgi:hypothetical protein
MSNQGHKFPTDLDCTFFGEIRADVHFDYEKEEPMEQHYPGCPELAEITDVVVSINGIRQSVMSLVPEYLVTELEDRALEWFNEQGE